MVGLFGLLDGRVGRVVGWLGYTKYCMWGVVVVVAFTLNRSFYPDISSAPSVLPDSSS